MDQQLKKSLFWMFILVFVIPGIPFVLGSIGILVYANWPSPVNVSLPEVKSEVESLTVVIHGKSDNSDTWAKKMVAGFQQHRKSNREYVVSIDWREYATDMFRCSRNGAVVGEVFAEQLMKNNPALKHVHFVAHSAGSFAAYRFCQTMKKQNPGITIHNSYLDPVSIYRGLDWDYGVRRFGDCADFAEAYINVGDGVPGSNVPLPNLYTHDVTALKPEGYKKTGHLWPVDYYLGQVVEGEYISPGPGFDSKRYPKGGHRELKLP